MRLHSSAYGGVEVGKRNPSIVVLAKIAEGLGTDIQPCLERV